MRLKLRTKLLLAASAMCLVPLAGYHALAGMRELMSSAQESATASAARSIAQVLVRGASDLSARAPPLATTPSLYLLPVNEAPQIDGYAEDWLELAPALPITESAVVAASSREQVYILTSLRLASAGMQAWLVLRSQNSPAFSSAWRIDLSERGATSVEEIAPLGEVRGAGFRDPRFQAAIQRVAGGLIVEISLPRTLLSANVSFDVMAPVSADPLTSVLETQALESLPARGRYAVAEAAPELQRRIAGLAGPGRRIWILDRSGHVLARDGAASFAADTSVMARVLAQFLPDADDSRLTLIPATGRIEAPEVQQALDGQPAIRWRRATDGDQRVVSAAEPIRAVGSQRQSSAIGAVVVEDTVAALKGFETRALLELVVATLAAFLLASVILLSVSARMVARLRSLRDSAAQAIDDRGRVRGRFDALAAGDEIGDLSRSFASALDRIQGYNAYLEQLARRLSHELRTPVAIVRSSLDNLGLSGDLAAPNQVYLTRAQDGVQRLDGLIARMTEAARLEQAVADEEREAVVLSELLEASVTANAEAFGDARLRLDDATASVQVLASPQLLVQALDKLLANARDFRTPGSEVVVRSRVDGKHVEIAVCNAGPLIAPGNLDAIFASMFSERTGPSDDGEMHLGLGLYVVRLIAQAHGGDTFARNAADSSGVCVGFRIATLAA